MQSQSDPVPIPEVSRIEYEDDSRLDYKVSCQQEEGIFRDTIHVEESTSSAVSTSEVEKWKKFGYLIAESFDTLKKDHETLKA